MYLKRIPLDFSFSGLKTSVLYTVKGQNRNKYSQLNIDEQSRKDVAASFQYVAFKDVIDKTMKAALSFDCKSIILGGGVTNNKALRAMFKEESSNIPILWPSHDLTLDNGAMIAGLGYHKYLSNPLGDSLDLKPFTRMIF